MNIYKPYTYFLKWSKTGMKYYGARWSLKSHPSDLWNPYKTSSEYVKEYIKLHGDPDIIKICRTFDNRDSVQIWENKVLKRLNAVKRDDFLNKNCGAGGWDPADIEIRAKISASRTGQLLSKETKIKISEVSKTIYHTPEWNAKVSKALLGKKHTPERIAAAKAGHAKIQPKTCPHCNLTGKGPNMTRYHFDKCKSKETT